MAKAEDQSSSKQPSFAGQLATFVATGFCVGLVPIAPGTVGALWGLPLAWGLSNSPPVVQIAAIIGIFLIGIPVCTVAARQLGGQKDPSSIVFDEIASLPVVYFLLPTSDWSWTIAVVGFLLHRVFDITKPPPARQLERLPSGLGIMADDMAAAVYANLALRLVMWMGWF